uniref:Uncharacterized protein n=1 Tax=Romanomermis culicivorax TaxID=13658 RepID=A0A915KKI9_ROMCU
MKWSGGASVSSVGRYDAIKLMLPVLFCVVDGFMLTSLAYFSGGSSKADNGNECKWKQFRRTNSMKTSFPGDKLFGGRTICTNCWGQIVMRPNFGIPKFTYASHEKDNAKLRRTTISSHFKKSQLRPVGIITPTCM